MLSQEPDQQSLLEARASPYIIIGSAIFSLMWGMINVIRVKNIEMTPDVI
jgi:hypothetical protein